MNETNVDKKVQGIYISNRFQIVESEIAKAEVLDLSVLVNPILGTLTPNPRLLDSAKGSLSARHEPLIDADHSHLQLASNPPALPDVVGVEVASKPNTGVIGDLDGFLK